MDSTAAKLAEIAIRQVGKLEQGGNNLGYDVVKYQGATNLDPGPWPWCAAFVCWCIREWTLNRTIDWRRPVTAAAFGFEKWARDNGLILLPEQAACEPGDVVIYDMSHCGIIVAAADQGSKLIEAVEGNTGVTGARDSNLGDGVYRKRRPRPMVRSFVRIQKAPILPQMVVRAK